MSAVAFPEPAIRIPGRRRHLVAVPQTRPAAPKRQPVREPAADRHRPTPGARAVPAPNAMPAQRAAPAAQRRADESRLHLTSRGRGVLATLALVCALVGGAGIGAFASSEVAPPADTQAVTVLPGQSLWGIASEVADNGQDVRIVMDMIMSLNSLSSVTVHPGQELTVPAT